jgi:hypothetical protein
MATQKDIDIISQIADRARALYSTEWSKVVMVKMLADAHAHMPIDLTGLLAAPDSDYIYDVFGITYHSEKNTGKIGGYFIPKFTLPYNAKKN